jgi:outer membrane lipoprotein carrier protein
MLLGKGKRIRTLFFIVLAFIGLNSFSAISFATKSPQEAVVKTAQNSASKSLFDLIQKLQNMHADFTQTMVTARGVQQESKGEMWISKPSYFKWEITSPNNQLLVSNGQKLWNYDKDLEQVTIQKVPKDMSQAPYLLLLTGQPENLDRLFSISKINEDLYRLTPKNQNDSILDHVDMRFNQGVLEALTIQTATGQTSTIRFSHQKFVKISLSTYDFVPPKGVDVLGA